MGGGLPKRRGAIHGLMPAGMRFGVPCAWCVSGTPCHSSCPPPLLQSFQASACSTCCAHSCGFYYGIGHMVLNWLGLASAACGKPSHVMLLRPLAFQDKSAKVVRAFSDTGAILTLCLGLFHHLKAPACGARPRYRSKTELKITNGARPTGLRSAWVTPTRPCE